MAAKPKPLFLSPETRNVPIERSRHVTNVSYRPESRILSVTFRNGDVYDYSDVPYKHAVALATAESVGSYLNGAIKPVFGGVRRKK